ncbi:MAG: hypothetical protein RLZZ263_951 [Cyanobacteriota bacterium]|jgi:hypothetical protein
MGSIGLDRVTNPLDCSKLEAHAWPAVSRRFLATLISAGVGGLSTLAVMPAQAYWYGYGWGWQNPRGCWGGPCWNRPLVVEPAPVLISPTAPVQVVQPGLPPISNPGGAIAVRNVCIASVIMRTGPSVAYAPVEVLTSGTTVQVINSLLNPAGYEWSLVQVGSVSGYVPVGSICL